MSFQKEYGLLYAESLNRQIRSGQVFRLAGAAAEAHIPFWWRETHETMQEYFIATLGAVGLTATYDQLSGDYRIERCPSV